jgi:VRR-NUC domain
VDGRHAGPAAVARRCAGARCRCACLWAALAGRLLRSTDAFALAVVALVTSGLLSVHNFACIQARFPADAQSDCCRCAERREARVVEVKGPTDHLSQQQRAWLRRLCGAGIDALVVKVLPPGGKRGR